MKTNAVVILWQGAALPDYLTQKIGEIFIANGISSTGDLTIKVMDEDSVAKAILRDAKPKINFEANANNEVEAIKNAVIFIGTKFEESLAKFKYNSLPFTTQLVDAVRDAKRNNSFVGVGFENVLLNAVSIIATSTVKIPQNLRRQYNFTEDVVTVIKNVNSYDF